MRIWDTIMRKKGRSKLRSRERMKKIKKRREIILEEVSERRGGRKMKRRMADEVGEKRKLRKGRRKNRSRKLRRIKMRKRRTTRRMK